jgi:CheY-like chemotaxis protein
MALLKKILVVEDNEDNRRILVYRLRKIGQFEIREATNGEQAVEAVKAERPDLIFMDLKMPVMDGWEATRRIRAMDGGRTIRIIALTAQAMAGRRAEGALDRLRRLPGEAGGRSRSRAPEARAPDRSGRLTDASRGGAFTAKFLAVAAIGCSGFLVAGGVPRGQDDVPAVRVAAAHRPAAGACRPSWYVSACASSPTAGCDAPRSACVAPGATPSRLPSRGR